MSIDPQQLLLPKEAKFCKKVMSNQRPRITFDADGICSACTFADSKLKEIDWVERKVGLRTFVIDIGV